MLESAVLLQRYSKLRRAVGPYRAVTQVELDERGAPRQGTSQRSGALFAQIIRRQLEFLQIALED